MSPNVLVNLQVNYEIKDTSSYGIFFLEKPICKEECCNTLKFCSDLEIDFFTINCIVAVVIRGYTQVHLARYYKKRLVEFPISAHLFNTETYNPMNSKLTKKSKPRNHYTLNL